MRPLDAAEVEDVRRLASDLPALWRADTTTPVDRKRLLRLVVAAVEIRVEDDRAGAKVSVLWSGGAKTAHGVASPGFGRHLRTDAGAPDAIRDLAARMPDHRVAAALAGRGLLTRHGKPWTQGRVAPMRRRYGIPTVCPVQTAGVDARADGFVPARVAAQRLGVKLDALRVWAHRGILARDRSRGAAKFWIKLGPGDAARVGGHAGTGGMQRVRDVAGRSGQSIAAVWQRMRAGEFEAYRAPGGRDQWEWWFLPRVSDADTPAGGQSPSEARRTA